MIKAISKILPIPNKSNFTKTMQQERKFKKKINKMIDMNELSFADHVELMCKFQ